MLAGVALFEMALVPGILIGGAAVLAPRYLPKGYLPKLRRRLQPLSEKTVDRRAATAAASLPAEWPGIGTAQHPLPKFAIGRAVAKTITFRIIVTTLDFSTNYLVIGEFATAAGLSTYNLIAGPLFYLGHEAAWTYFGPSEAAVDLAALTPMAAAANARPGILGGLTISRALAKTITFRTIASAMDFATNYFVVRDVGQALICQPAVSCSARLFISATRRPGSILAHPRNTRSIPRARRSCCRRLFDRRCRFSRPG